MRISDAVAIVSGGASGLGEATCRRLATAGARGIAVLDVDEERGGAVSAALGERCAFFATDMTDEEAVQRSVDSTLERFGLVNVVVAAAGIVGPGKLIGRSGPLPMDRFDAVLRVNLYGAVHVLRPAVAAMQGNDPGDDGERGVVVLVSSAAAFEGQVGQVAYSASKGALAAMTMPLARELSVHGIRVVTVAPGAFDTPIYEQVPPAVKESLVQTTLHPKRLGRPEEFALFVEELIRNPAHNGRVYRLDGGAILPPGL